MAKCKCIPHPDDIAKYPLYNVEGGRLWPVEMDCAGDPTKDAPFKKWCTDKTGPWGKAAGPGAAPIAEYPPGSGEKIPVPGLPWIWVDVAAEKDAEAEKVEGGVAPPAEKTVAPPPAPPPTTYTGSSVPEALSDFNDQCFLLEFAQPIYKKFGPDEAFLKSLDLYKEPVRSLSWLKKNEGSATTPWKENIAYISHITAGSVPEDTMRNFFEMTAAEKAQLSPFIQISVDMYDKDATRKESWILDFPNHTDLDPSILQSTGERKLAGIKSVTIDLDGINQVMAKVVKLRASFVFQDFRTIFKKQKDVQGGPGTGLRRYYSDLFSYGARDLNSENQLYKKLRFKIGWAGRTHTINSEKDSLSKKLGLDKRTLVLDVGIEK